MLLNFSRQFMVKYYERSPYNGIIFYIYVLWAFAFSEERVDWNGARGLLYPVRD
jgi:hypothetical protein